MTELAKPTLLVLASTYPRWNNDPEPGFVHELCRRLVESFDVIALVPDAPGADPDGILDGVEVVRFRYAPRQLQTLVNDGGIVTNLKRQPWKWLLVPGFLLASMWSAWRVMHRERPDVIHAHWLIPQGLVVALLGLFDRRVPPFLVTSHGADLFALRARPLQALKRFVIRRSAMLTVVSSSMRDAILQLGVNMTTVAVQPMGVDLQDRFSPDTAIRRSNSELLFVGRLVEKKGLRHLLDALPIILERFPDVILKVVGFGPERAALQAQTEALGLTSKVNFLGAVPQKNLPGHYRRAVAFVAPFVEAEGGDQEGLGLVLVEALGCGCPVVTTEIPAVREVFGGKWPQFTALPGSVDSLAQEVMKVLEHGVAAGRAVMVDLPALRVRFDWQTVADDYARMLMGMRRTTQ